MEGSSLDLPNWERGSVGVAILCCDAVVGEYRGGDGEKWS